ncbi:hypothetical protein HHX38_01775 [Streptomyces sp. PKU-MA01144]|uniref:hypothetical protein n=1 Tax=Streptomyces sp. PKU-MA01144 TaxID=2729138 RepID=UPI00147F07B5|nr:hypothetical protein [Streptomyces sp. PKU-MA01144]NNJ02877.1 hypothetical protein [Streptomyces sp. PKU-MA01144]
MTPKLRTHCATTLAALVLALPVATYAYTEGPPAHAGESRGDGGESREDRGARGQGGRATSGEGGRHDGPRREESGGPGGARQHDGAPQYGGADRRTPGHGSPAHGPPAAHPLTGRAAAGPDPGEDGDRPPANPRAAGKPHTPLQQQAAERPTPSPTASLAGRQAGQGRLRPGRTAAPSVGSPASPDRPDDGHDGREGVHDGVHDGELDHGRDRDPDGSAAPRDEEAEESQSLHDDPAPSEPTPADDPSPAAAGRSHPHPVPQPLERQVSALTLGAGCALMGLGLGYMGLRLRRG